MARILVVELQQQRSRMKKWMISLACLFSFTPLISDEGVFYGPKEPYTCWVTGEFLYWKVFQGGMEYADSFNEAVGDLADARGHEIDFDYKPGFRVGVGLLTPCCLDFNANYTRFYAKESESVTDTLFPTFNYFGSPQGLLIPSVASAAADWRLCFQTAELEMGRVFSPSCAFALHPHLGVQGAWIDQKAEINYVASDGSPYNITFKNDFWGVGLKGGVDAGCQLRMGFSVFGDLALSLLYGHFDVHQVQLQIGVPQIDLSQTFWRIAPALQTSFGLAWEPICLCNCPFPFVVSAAVEWQYWWSQNQTQRFTSSSDAVHLIPEYDLGLFGLTVRGTLYF
jgi:Legionella pneumophila major outer membrane protein precursor